MPDDFDQEDPFKKYGGSEIKQEDPFAKYGGKTITPPLKKKIETPSEGFLGGVAAGLSGGQLPEKQKISAIGGQAGQLAPKDNLKGIDRLDRDINNIFNNYQAVKVTKLPINAGGDFYDKKKIAPIDINDNAAIGQLISEINQADYLEGTSKGQKQEFIQALNTRALYNTAKQGITPTINQLGKQVNEAVVRNIIESERGEDKKSSVKDDEQKINHFKWGLSHIEKTDPARFNNVIATISQKKQVPESDFYALTTIGQEIENAVKSKSAVVDPEWEKARTNIDYTTFGQKKAKLAGLIGEELKKKGYGNQAEFTEEQIREGAKLVEKNQKVKVNPEALNELLTDEKILFYDAIPKGKWMDDVAAGIMQPIAGVKSTLQTMGETPAETYLRSQKLDEGIGGQKVPDAKGQYSDILPSEREDWKTGAFRGAGQMLTNIALARGFGGIGNKVLGTSLNAAQKANMVNYFGTGFSTYLQTYGQEYEDALRRTGDAKKAKLLAAIDSGFTAGWEMLLPDVKIARESFDGVKRALGDQLESVIAKGGSAQQMAREARPFIDRAVKNISTIWGKEIGEEVGTNFTDYMTELVFSPKTGKERNLGEELTETLKEAAKATVIPAVVGGGASSLQTVVDEETQRDKLIQTAKDSAKDLSEMYRVGFEENPEAALKEVAQQLNASEGEAKAARRIYGDKISDAALELFPDEKVETSVAMQELLNQPKDEEIIHEEKIITPEGEATPITETNVDVIEQEPTVSEVVDLSKDEVGFEDRYLNDFNLVEDSSFDWRVTSSLSTADRKKAVQDIRDGKDTAAARKLKQEIKDSFEKGTITINRGRGNNATTVEIPINEWFALDTNEQEAADKMADEIATIINENDITLQNIDELNHLFNGFPYTKEDLAAVKDYLARQGKSNDQTKPISQGSQEAQAIKSEATPETSIESTQSEQPIQEIKTDEGIAEPPSPPTEAEGTAAFIQRPATQLSFRGLQNIANEFSLEDVKSRDTKTDIQLRQEARETVDSWAEKGQYAKNIEKLVEKAENAEILTDKERVILEGHLANVSEEARIIRKEKGVLSKEYEEKLSELKRLKDAGNQTRSEAAAALRIPTFSSTPQTVEDAMILEKDISGVDVLTDAQKEKVVKEFEEIKAANDALQQKINALEEENARIKAGEVVSNERKRERRGKKTSEQFKTERAKIVDDIKEKLKKSRQETQATVVPYLKELIAIAPDVGRLVKNLVDDGITQLSDIVDNIHDYLKDEIAGIEKKDIVDLIAGVYDEKKPTRNQLAAKVVDLKQEAKLVNKYEALLAGKEPISEKKKVERNRELAELRKKIKDNDLTKLANRKAQIKAAIEKVEAQIKKGDFDPPPPKKKMKFDKEANDLKDKLIKLKQQRDARILLTQRQRETKKEKGIRLATEVANVPRTLMTIGDFSGLLRQGIFGISHPVMMTKAAKEMFRAAFSQKVYDRWFADLKDDPRYVAMQESRLAIADSLSHDLTQREEAFMSTLAEKIPLIGQTLRTKDGKTIIPGLNIVKGSERSYTMLLNKMRVDLFNYFADKMEARGLTMENSPKQYKAMAEYINNSTGRSDFGKTLNRVAPVLNTALFSPRLMASRINMLTYWAQPRFWTTLPREAKADYFRSWASLLGVGLTVMALAKAGGAEVEDDPRSSDFGKIKEGDTRWDIWGGTQPYIRVMSQIVSGQRKSTNTGELYELTGDDVFGETRAGVVTDFLRGKLSPVFGSFVDVLSGRTTTGDKIVYEWDADGAKEIPISTYIKERLLPMTITGTQEAIKERGPMALLSVGIPNVFGIGTQTYGKPVKEVKDEVNYEGRKVKLTPEQHKEYRTKANEFIEKNMAKLKSLKKYKEIEDRNERMAIERMVKNEAVRRAEDLIIEKYKSKFPKESKEEEKDKKEKTELRKEIMKEFKK